MNELFMNLPRAPLLRGSQSDPSATGEMPQLTADWLAAPLVRADFWGGAIVRSSSELVTVKHVSHACSQCSV